MVRNKRSGEILPTSNPISMNRLIQVDVGSGKHRRVSSICGDETGYLCVNGTDSILASRFANRKKFSTAPDIVERLSGSTKPTKKQFALGDHARSPSLHTCDHSEASRSTGWVCSGLRAASLRVMTSQLALFLKPTV